MLILSVTGIVAWVITRSDDVLGVHPDGLWLRVHSGRRRLYWYSWAELARIQVGMGLGSITMFVVTNDGPRMNLTLPISGNLRQLAALLRSYAAGRCLIGWQRRSTRKAGRPRPTTIDPNAVGTKRIWPARAPRFGCR